jgi:hypothetical protein
MVTRPSNSVPEPSPDAPYFNPMHNHPEVREDYAAMMELLQEIEDRPRQEQPRRFWDVNRHEIEFRRQQADATGLPRVDTDDGTFVLVNGKATKLCYDCNERLPYYKGQCQPCRQEYGKKANFQRRVQRKSEILADRGGKCEWCGHVPNPLDDTDKMYLSVKEDFVTEIHGARSVLDYTYKNFRLNMHKVQILCRTCNRYRKRGINTKKMMLQLIYEDDRLRKDIQY